MIRGRRPDCFRKCEEPVTGVEACAAVAADEWFDAVDPVIPPREAPAPPPPPPAVDELTEGELSRFCQVGLALLSDFICLPDVLLLPYDDPTDDLKLLVPVF